MGSRINDSDNAVFSCLGVVALCALSLVGAPLLDGYVLAALWRWFVTPTFALPALGILQALGLALCARAMRPVMPPEFDDKGDPWKPWIRVGKAVVLGPVFLLVVGYVVHRFMEAAR